MQRNKGFTLVELLAVVVILGIIMTVSIPAVSKWINRSKGESKEAQKQTLLLAGQAYAQGNSKVLPKAIGETKLIKAIDLRKANYLKEDLVDSDKKDCMKDSVVRIYKYDRNGYSYTAYLYCEGDTVPNSITGIKPVIGITFTGENLKDDVMQDVSKAGFKITINGGKKDGKNLGIDGYTYSISAKYADTGEIVEIFNSGSLNAGGKEKLIIEKSLGDYTNITTLSEFMITAEAYNRDGGYEKETANSKYGDSTPPVCGEITGQAGENQWFSSPHTITISVKCSDEANGSGCVKDEFTKSWNTEVEDDYIEIKDKSGNTTKCKVRVHHDWTRPTLTVTAYVRTSDGGKGSQVGSITANNANPEVTLSSYTGDYGNNHWLNHANFPYGVYFEITAIDNIHVNRGEWYYNSTGISVFNASNLNSMNVGTPKSFSKTDSKTAVYLSGEGIRRAKYTLTDKAGNKVTVNIQSNIDRTHPTCVSSGGSSAWTNNKRTLTGTCSDSLSKCKGNITKDFTTELNSTTSSPGTVYDNANNPTTCPGNQTVRIDKTPPGCKATKTYTQSPFGVNVNLKCYDSGGSGLTSCPCTFTKEYGACLADSGVKSGKSYSVSDAAGNSGGCSVSVTSFTAYSKSTRTCVQYKSCSSCDCASYALKSFSGGTAGAGCWGCGYVNSGDDDILVCNCCTSYKACSACGCAAYSAWSGWSTFSKTVCTANDYTRCFAQTQYE